MFVKLSSVEHGAVRGRTEFLKRWEIESGPRRHFIGSLLLGWQFEVAVSVSKQTMKIGGSVNKWHTGAIQGSLSNAKSFLVFMAILYEM